MTSLGSSGCSHVEVPVSDLDDGTRIYGDGAHDLDEDVSSVDILLDPKLGTREIPVGILKNPHVETHFPKF